MQFASLRLGAVFALSSFSLPLIAQDVQPTLEQQAVDHRVLLRYATFDPLFGAPEVPGTLRSAADTHLWIVQFHSAPTDAERDVLRTQGAKLVGSLPHDSLIVQMSHATAAAIAVLREVRWVGGYEPAYRLDPALLQELMSAQLPTRAYNMVMADKWKDKASLEAKIVAMGGKVIDRHIQGLLFTAELTGEQLIQAARLDEVLWIDAWTAPGEDMDNARIVQGSNTIQTAAGYTGSGVRGHVYEGVEAAHPDFTTAMTNVRSSGAAQAHGHCTAGCIFGNGNSAAQARGHAPGAVGFYTNYSTVTAGWSRNAVISDVVNVHNCMFTTASWGASQTTAYTSVSADADDIVFDHRIPWTNSMSNLGNQNVRPEAWAKNVISVGGLFHQNDSNPANDSWSNGASIGPAADGRLKPDLCNFYDNVWTSDLSGTAGYNTAAGVAGNSTTGFNGTSSATPITAGLNALAIQMYTDFIFNNTPRVSGGTRFQNRPFAQTLKALQIACASLYPISQATRAQAGWGYGNVATMYNRRNSMFIVPEDRPITQGATHTYQVSVMTGETSLKVCMTYLDPQGVPAAALTRINDLTLRVIAPNGTGYWGNVGLTAANTSSTGGAANTIDTVENVFLNNPTPGLWTIQITAPTIAQDAHLATGATDATYALVVNGGRQVFGSGCARYLPDTNPDGGGNVIPFGTSSSSSLPSVFTSNNGGNIGGAIYFNINNTAPLYLTGLDINTNLAAGSPVLLDVYRTALNGGYGGNEGNRAAWTPISAGRGTSAGQDVATTIELTQPTLLQTGTYGIAIVARNFSHRYTNGTGTNQTYSNADLTATFGAASNAPFDGSPFTPRVGNITFRYLRDDSSWVNQRYQTILRREELGAAGTIRGIAFASNSDQRHWNNSLLIRMSHVPAGHSLSSTFATNLPSPVTVLNQSNYTWHTNTDTWREVGFQSSFAYNGTSDVVVDIVARGNVASIEAGSFNSSPSLERVFEYGWTGATPTIGTYNTGSGLRMRVNMNCAVGQNYGQSCGPLTALAFSTPVRGGTAWFDLTNAVPNDGAIIALGFNNGSPYPITLNPYGLTNCYSWHDLTSTIFKTTGATGFSTHAISVPNVASYDGLKIHGQWYQLDATQPGGITASNYVTNMIGIGL
ncbi:MAG: S8 family serine peptidase [Planctomycetes bacterium]|nr:S8 family serine peptidase [Planctomycetota bacterium]